jgi:hypothetical protein
MLPASYRIRQRWKARYKRFIAVCRRRHNIFNIAGVLLLVGIIILELAPFASPAASAKDHTNPSVDETCRHVDFSPDGNPFPICPGPFPVGGNCVWWAWEQWHLLGYDLPLNWGNAADWIVDAQLAGLPLGTTPRVGSIAVFPRADGVWAFGTPGHVAFVTAVSSDGLTFDVTYQNYGDPNPLYFGKGYNVNVINQPQYQDGELRFIYFPQQLDAQRFAHLAGIETVNPAAIAWTNALLGNAGGSPTSTATTTAATSVSLNISRTSSDQEFNADFTGEGFSDLLLYNRQQGALKVLQLRQTSTSQTTTSGSVLVSLGDSLVPAGHWGSSLEIHVGNFSGASKSEILLYDHSNAQIHLLSLTPQLTIQKHVVFAAPGTNWELYVGRFDGQRTGVFMYNRYARATVSATPTATPTSSSTVSVVSSPTTTSTPTPSPTTSVAVSSTPTLVPTPTPSPAVTPTPVPTTAPTVTATSVPTVTPTTRSNHTTIVTPTLAATPIPTAQPTTTAVATPTPTIVLTPTAAPTPTISSSSTAKSTAKITPTPDPTVVPTALPTSTPTVKPTSTPTIVPTQVPSPAATPTPVPTIASASVLTVTPTPVTSPTTTATPTPTPQPQKPVPVTEVATSGTTTSDLSGIPAQEWEKQGRLENILLLDFNGDLSVRTRQSYTLWHSNWEVYVGRFDGPQRDGVFLYDRIDGQGRLLDFDATMNVVHYQSVNNLSGNWQVYSGDFAGAGHAQLLLYDPADGHAQMLKLASDLTIAGQKSYTDWGTNKALYVGHFGLPSLSVMLYDSQMARSTFLAFDTSLQVAHQYNAQSWDHNWQILVGAFLDRSRCVVNGNCATGDDILVLNRQTGQLEQYIFSFGRTFKVYDNRMQSFVRDGVASQQYLDPIDTTTFNLVDILNTTIRNEELY